MADDKPSYLRRAFLNAYNLAALGTAAAATAMTGEWAVGALAAGVETLWLLFAPDLRPFRRRVDQWHRHERQRAERQRVARSMETLPEREWARAHALRELQREIERDMQNNVTFQALVLQTEVEKLAQLHAQFVVLASGCARAEQYLAATDARDVQRQMEVQRNLERSSGDPAVQTLARKNAQVLEKRGMAIEEIRKFLARARGQMTLIENTVRLLRDQVLTMQSPEELGDQLDDLIRGVEALQASTRESEEVLGLELAPVAPIVDPGVHPGKGAVTLRE